MRAIIICAALAACESAAGRPAGLPFGPGITPDVSTGSTGEGPRLDLGPEAPIPDLPSETGGTTGDASTGEASSALGSSGYSTGEASTGGSSSGSSSTGEASTGEPGTSTGEASSSTGEPPPPTCGDAACEASERAPCWGPGWCFVDCYKAPECESDCPCTPAAAAVKNFCSADPLPACAATAPGGYCEQGDDVQGFYAWHAKCGG